MTEAAAAVGKNCTSILRAIKAGKLSAARDPVSGDWRIEPSAQEQILNLRQQRDREAEDRRHAQQQLLEVQANLTALLTDQRSKPETVPDSVPARRLRWPWRRR